jgi:Ca2+-binding RTX toxin-like protein
VGNNYTAAGWTGTIKVGTSSNNALGGGNGADLMLGLGGNDKLDGKGGDDVLCGGDGADLLDGGAGNDTLDGGAGNDVLNGGTGDFDTMLGGEGNDVLLDGTGVISAQGGPGNDVITIALRDGWRDPQGQSSQYLQRRQQPLPACPIALDARDIIWGRTHHAANQHVLHDLLFHALPHTCAPR